MNTDTVTLALTLRPEWAWAVCHLGKTIENRACTSRRLVGRRIAITAGLSWGGKRSKDASWRRDALAAPAGISAQAGRVVSLETHPSTVLAEIEGDPRRWHPADQQPPSHTPHATPIPCGAVVATALISSIGLSVETLASPWSVPEQWHWTLADVQVLDAPIPCKGQLQLGWMLPLDVRRQLADAATAPAWRIGVDPSSWRVDD